MKFIIQIVTLIILLQFNPIVKASESSDNHDNILSQESVRQSILETLDVLDDVYVYPEKTAAIRHVIIDRMNQGKYDGIKTKKEFVSILTQELMDAGKDGHLGLMLVKDDGSEPTHILTETEDDKKNNHAFQKVEVLKNNIGYLKFNKFYADEEAQTTVDHAFGFLSNTDAMIIDLRDCIGGSPELVQYMLSHFFVEETLLWRFHNRGNELVFDHVSLKDIGHKKFKSNYPLFILVGEDTASAAELFAYTLKHHNKATIIGQTTMGIAHAVSAVKINQHFTGRFSMSRLSNPITQKDWERVGVIPDINTELDKSLKVAQIEATNHLKSQPNNK
ncbi:S41 family peptidase [Marinicella sp. W31]|uniref:S41 family peptidase n=1 Tax=Marinicella sp. W31 TaxID=3023713 RepID=UPI003756FCAB